MSKPAKGLYKFAVEVLRPVAKLTTKPHWAGRDNMPKNKPFILIMNHLSYYDIPVITHFIVDEGHAVRVLAKDSLFDTPGLGMVMKRTKMVPVVRDSAQAGDSLKHAKQALAEGESIAIFPEGTLTKDPDKWPMEFKTGAARLALSTGAPVIPLVHWQGERANMPSSSLPIHRMNTWIVAGPAIDLSDLNQDEDDRDAVNAATRRMEAVITKMVENIRGVSAPPTRWDPKLDAYPPEGEPTTEQAN